eukprot:8489440-Pyramimonas_sp.AAC.1
MNLNRNILCDLKQYYTNQGRWFRASPSQTSCQHFSAVAPDIGRPPWISKPRKRSCKSSSASVKMLLRCVAIRELENLKPWSGVIGPGVSGVGKKREVVGQSLIYESVASVLYVRAFVSFAGMLRT